MVSLNLLKLEDRGRQLSRLKPGIDRGNREKSKFNTSGFHASHKTSFDDWNNNSNIERTFLKH